MLTGDKSFDGRGLLRETVALKFEVEPLPPVVTKQS